MLIVCMGLSCVFAFMYTEHVHNLPFQVYTGPLGSGTSPSNKDILLGGIINLGTRGEAFEYVPCTQHLQLEALGPARSKMDCSFVQSRALCEQNIVCLEIPPGYMLVFNPVIYREARYNKSLTSSNIITLDWRLVDSCQPISKIGSSIQSHPLRILRDMHVPILGNGEPPLMYSSVHKKDLLWSKHSPILWSQGGWMHRGMLMSKDNEDMFKDGAYIICQQYIVQPLTIFLEDSPNKQQFPKYSKKEKTLYSLQALQIARSAARKTIDVLTEDVYPTRKRMLQEVNEVTQTKKKRRGDTINALLVLADACELMMSSTDSVSSFEEMSP